MSKKNIFEKQRPSFKTPQNSNEYDLSKKEKAIIQSAGMRLSLQKDPGIFLGTEKDQWDCVDYRDLCSFPNIYVGKPQLTDGHCAVFGSSGSGKGSCIAVPTMISWGNSPMIVLDPKGDLSEYYKNMTFSEKRPIKIFNPARDDTSTYDPFSHIVNDKKDNRVANIRELVNAIIPSPLDSRDRFWITAAQKILTGGFLYFLDLAEYNTDPKNSVNFYSAIDCITSLSLEELFEKINKSDNTAAKKYIRSFSGRDFLSDSEMLMDINETLDTYLINFINDKCLENALIPSSEHDSIDWEKDIDEYSIFLSIPEDRIDQWGALLNIMITQLIRTLERRPERYSPQGAKLKPVLLLLDEFPMIGRINVLANALSMLRSKNVTILLIAQSISQLDAIYGREGRNIMLENCDFQAVLRVNCADSQKYFSDLAGTVSELSWSVSDNYTHRESHIKHESHSESASNIDVPFIRPEELAHLNNELVLFTPYRTFRIKKCPFYKWKSEIFIHLPNPQVEEDADCLKKESAKNIPSDARKNGRFTFRNLNKE